MIQFYDCAMNVTPTRRGAQDASRERKERKKHVKECPQINPRSRWLLNYVFSLMINPIFIWQGNKISS